MPSAPDILLGIACAVAAAWIGRQRLEAAPPGPTRRAVAAFLIAGLLWLASAAAAFFALDLASPARFAAGFASFAAVVLSWRSLATPVPAPLMSTAEPAIDPEAHEELRRDHDDLRLRLEEAERKLAESTQRFEIALHGSGMTLAHQDRDLRYTAVYHAAPGLDDLLGRTDSEALTGEAAAEMVPLKKQVLETGAAAERELMLRTGRGPRWFKVRVEPSRTADGRVQGLTSIAIDVTATKDSEQHLRALLRELTHRSRNLLAVIQGIARRTAASSHDFETFLERFGARLQALAAAHDILIDRAWKGASMQDLVDVQLANVGEVGSEQVTVEGEPLLLRPDAAQHLSLALHELATNAVEHGALSKPTGHVDLKWHPDPDDPTRIELVWKELGGPAVERPARPGFGTTVLHQLVPRGVDGDATLEFAPEGFVWKLRMPRSNLLEQMA